MSETSTVPQPSAQWIGKAEAARRLKRSERTVLEWADAGKIQSRRVQAPSGQTVRELHAGDIERLIYERAHPAPQPDPPKAAIALQTRALALPQPPAVPQPPASPRPWLTLDEAAAFSGLTKRWLLAQAEAKWPIPITETGTSTVALPTWLRDQNTRGPVRPPTPDPSNPSPHSAILEANIRDMGKHAPGGRWRFHRESLERA